MIIRDADVIIKFLTGEGEDHKGRTFSSIIESDNKELERCHDAIQWVFMIHETSKHAHTYPVITEDIITIINRDSIIRGKVGDNLGRAKDRYEGFFGIVEGYEDPNIQRKWCKDYNHNLLRVTRIIRSLRLFKMEYAAYDFYTKVKAVGERLGVSKVTLEYWDKAMKNDVWESLQ